MQNGRSISYLYQHRAEIGFISAIFHESGAHSIYGQHVANARAMGLFRYLDMDNFIHRNTDGPLNPYAKVYDLQEVKKDFPDFKIVHSYKQFMHAPPLPMHWLPFDQALGWHLWVHMRPNVNAPFE